MTVINFRPCPLLHIKPTALLPALCMLLLVFDARCVDDHFYKRLSGGLYLLHEFSPSFVRWYNPLGFLMSASRDGFFIKILFFLKNLNQFFFNILQKSVIPV